MNALVEQTRSLAGYRTRTLGLEGDGPPVLMLHGYSDSADTWRPLLAELARDGRRAIAVDMPGFGTASPLSDGSILPQLDLFATAALEHFAGDEPAVVMGNSLGGCVALRLACQGDLPLAGVVPVAPAGLDMARWIALVERDPVVRFLLELPVPLPVPIVRGLIGEVYRRLAFRHPRRVAGDVVTRFADHFNGRETLRSYLSTARRLYPELHEPFELERITCPVLIVWGDSDLLVFPEGADRVITTVPGARLEAIEDCGHCPQVEAAERLAELLREFLGAAASSPATAGTA